MWSRFLRTRSLQMTRVDAFAQKRQLENLDSFQPQTAVFSPFFRAATLMMLRGRRDQTSPSLRGEDLRKPRKRRHLDTHEGTFLAADETSRPPAQIVRRCRH
jgi:hypothetical protein